jgi:hypothetical protein
MIEESTALILGAGTSQPYGFLLGLGLRDYIQEKIAYNNLIYKMIFEFYGYDRDDRTSTFSACPPVYGGTDAPEGAQGGQELPPDCTSISSDVEARTKLGKLIKDFEVDFSRSPLSSIDAFLEHRPEFIEIGKIAIAVTLIPCEKRTKLRRVPREKRKWLDIVFETMSVDPDPTLFLKNNLNIITFNYDRTVEYFFFEAIQSTYGLDDEETVKLVQSIPVVHVHGKLGEPHFLSRNGRDYDETLDGESIKKSVEGIKVIHEQSEEEDAFKDAYELIKRADRLCFLGFGYNPINLRRLRIRDLFIGREIFGSTLGMGYSAIKDAHDSLHFRAQNRVIAPKLDDVNSLQFLLNHQVLK